MELIRSIQRRQRHIDRQQAAVYSRRRVTAAVVKRMNVVYLGTPEFAVGPLQALAQSQHTLLCVVTGPDKQSGRGRKVAPTPVKQAALELNLPVLTPRSLRDPQLLQTLRELEPELFVVIAFRILPPELFTLPRRGSINIHGSLLPRYRGAAPIQHALFDGETETGLSAFYLKRSVDTGDVINQERITIDPADTYTALAEKMSAAAGPFLLKTLDLIERGAVIAQPQDESLATPAPKITPEDCLLDWTQPAERIVNRIRGLADRPGAITRANGARLKVLAARALDSAPAGLEPAPGSLLIANKRIFARCGQRSAVEIIRLQPEGKKIMTAQEVINGQSLAGMSSLGGAQ